MNISKFIEDFKTGLKHITFSDEQSILRAMNAKLPDAMDGQTFKVHDVMQATSNLCNYLVVSLSNDFILLVKDVDGLTDYTLIESAAIPILNREKLIEQGFTWLFDSAENNSDPYALNYANSIVETTDEGKVNELNKKSFSPIQCSATFSGSKKGVDNLKAIVVEYGDKDRAAALIEIGNSPQNTMIIFGVGYGIEAGDININ